MIYLPSLLQPEPLKDLNELVKAQLAYHAAAAEALNAIQGDIEELRSELSGLDAKIEGFQAELRSPMAQNLTSEEEDLIETLGREVEQRQRNLVELGKQKNQVSLAAGHWASLGI